MLPPRDVFNELIAVYMAVRIINTVVGADLTAGVLRFLAAKPIHRSSLNQHAHAAHWLMHQKQTILLYVHVKYLVYRSGSVLCDILGITR